MEDHQFWMNDPKIVESLLTIHRSAKHLLDFTSSIVNSHEPVLGQRPIPVMSNGDVLFMTQLSNDIARSVGGISAVRHHVHGSRAAARKRSRREADDRDREPHAGASAKRLQVQVQVPQPQPHQHQHHHHHHHRRRRSSSAPSKAAVSSRTGVVPRAAAVALGGGGELVCRKCGRTDTPEWRKGPDGGVLCNVCGLVYAKQRRKMRSSLGGTHPSQSHHGQ